MHLRTVKRANYGMTGDAKQLLKLSALFLYNGVAPPEPFAKYLAMCMSRIAELDNPWGAPLLARKKGQKSRDLYDRHLAIAREVNRLHEKLGIPLNADSASTTPGALELVGNQFGMTIPAVKKHYRKHYAKPKP
jgi:hypothetical protein